MSKTIEKEDIHFGKEKVRDAYIQGTTRYVQVLAGSTEHPTTIDLWPNKPLVNFHTEKHEWQMGKAPRKIEFNQAASFEKEDMFNFYFGITKGARANITVDVKITSQGLFFPGILTPEEIGILRNLGVPLSDSGPNLKDVNKISKALKGNTISKALRGFSYRELEYGRKIEIEDTLNIISKFSKEIEKAAGFPREIEKLKENKKIKQLLLDAEKQNEEERERMRGMKGFIG